MAFGTLSFDELNQMVGYNRSMPFEQYFGEIVALTEDQRKERIRLAELLEEQFLIVLELLFLSYPDEIGIDVVDDIRSRYIGALEAAGLLSMAALEGTNKEVYLVNHAAKFATDAVASTIQHKEEPYEYSADRAAFMAENESQIVYNASDFYDEMDAPDGATHKMWATMGDEKVRETHSEVDGEIIPIDEPFYVGGSEMMFAGDGELGAGAEELVNCRCITLYGTEEELG